MTPPVHSTNTLLIVRHAKSSWKDPRLEDHERPLNKRGRRDAPEMARRLAERGHAPDVIVSSPAVRALATAKIIAAELGIAECEIVVNEDVYAASSGELLDVARGVDDSVGRLMIVGHNPGLTDFVNELTNADIENVPTCGIALVRFRNVRWKDVEFGTGELAEYDFPNNSV